MLYLPPFLGAEEKNAMSLEKVNSGRDVPNDINVIIDIPSHSDPVKYEVYKDSGAMFVDRFMITATFYPCNYGYVPQTLSEDGDPVDVLVVTPIPLISGAVIRCRPLGMLKMSDEAGVDAKLVAVPVDKLTPLYQHCKTTDDLAPSLLAQIAHFFEHYKDLEKGKWVKVDGWAGVDEAKAEIVASVQRFQKKAKKAATHSAAAGRSGRVIQSAQAPLRRRGDSLPLFQARSLIGPRYRLGVSAWAWVCSYRAWHSTQRAAVG